MAPLFSALGKGQGAQAEVQIPPWRLSKKRNLSKEQKRNSEVTGIVDLRTVNHESKRSWNQRLNLNSVHVDIPI